MNTRRMHTLQVTGLLLIGLLALVAYQVTGTERPMEPEVGNVRDSSSLSEGQSTRSLAADQARWEAKAEQHNVLSDGTIRAEQARWNMILQSYAEAARERSLAADEARWHGQAEFFASEREVVATGRSDLALAAHYTGLAFQHHELTGNTASLPGSVSPALRGLLAAGGVHVDTVMAASPARQNQ